MPDDHIPYWRRVREEETPQERSRRLERERIRQKAWQERMKRKAELVCDQCGAELLDYATYCGFCEIELGLAPAR